MEAALHPWPALGVLLLRDGLVSKEDLERILVEQRDSRHQRISGWRLGEVLTERGIVTQAQVAKLVAEQYELPFIELRETDIDLEATRLLPAELSRRFSALPIQILDDGSVLLAVADPGLVLFSEELRAVLAVPLRFAVVAQDAMDAAREFVSRGAQAVAGAPSEDVSSASGLVAVAHARDHPAPPLGALLVRDGLVSEDELDAALTQQRLTANKRLGEILVERGIVSRTDVARVVAHQYELPFLDLVESEIDAQAAALLPVDVARRYEAIPTAFRSDGTLRVAIADPTKVVLSDEILLTLGVRVSFAVAAPDAIAAAIESHYGFSPSTLEPAGEEVPAEAHEPIAGVAEPATGAIDEILMEAAGAVAETLASEGPPDMVELDEVVEWPVTEALEETVATTEEAVDPAEPHDASEPSAVYSLTDRGPGMYVDPLVGDEATDYVAVRPVVGEGMEEPPFSPTLLVDPQAAPDRTSELPELDRVAEAEDVDATETPAVGDVEAVVEHALALGASTVHVSPQQRGLVVRARVEGAMRELGVIQGSTHTEVTARLKAMCELDAERGMQIAVLPTKHGEKVTLRVVDPPTPRSLSEIGMAADDEDAFRAVLQQPSGIVLVCGPAVSGRTTTLYAALQELNAPERTLTTIKDPVEYPMPGIDQTELDPRAGLTFPRGLRTILRSDSDVILVGEIRDEEIAEIAVEAAMSGHLVLSAIHARTAASAVERLTDLGIEPSLLGESLTCVVAQRLARRICMDCRETYYPSAEELVELGRPEERPGTRLLARGHGCSACGGTGYRDRVGVFELLTLTDDVRRVVASGASTSELDRTAVAAGMRRLREDGIRLCLDGITTPSEIRRVLGDRW